MIKVKGNELKSVYINGINLDKVFYNGVEVFSKVVPAKWLPLEGVTKVPNLQFRITPQPKGTKSVAIAPYSGELQLSGSSSLDPGIDIRGKRLRISGKLTRKGTDTSVEDFSFIIPNTKEFSVIGEFNLDSKNQSKPVKFITSLQGTLDAGSTDYNYHNSLHILAAMSTDDIGSGYQYFDMTINKVEYDANAILPKYKTEICLDHSKGSNDYLHITSGEQTTTMLCNTTKSFNQDDIVIMRGIISSETNSSYASNNINTMAIPGTNITHPDNIEYLTAPGNEKAFSIGGWPAKVVTFTSFRFTEATGTNTLTYKYNPVEYGYNFDFAGNTTIYKVVEDKA